jgi:hypothetical protein
MSPNKSSVHVVDVDTKDMQTTKHFEYSDQSENVGLTWTLEEEKKLVRKIDLMLMPMIWFMYLLSYMDRTKSVPLRVLRIEITDMVPVALETRRLPVWLMTSSSLQTNTALPSWYFSVRATQSPSVGPSLTSN